MDGRLGIVTKIRQKEKIINWQTNNSLDIYAGKSPAQR